MASLFYNHNKPKLLVENTTEVSKQANKCGFFHNYMPELLAHSENEVRNNPNEQNVLTRLVVLNLKKHIEDSKPVQYNSTQTIDFIKGLENIANMGNPFSLFLLGMLKLEGLGSTIRQDELTGYSLISAAAVRDCSLALHAMGSFCMHGNKFIPQDHHEAKKYFAKALVVSNNGDKRAIKNLYICCCGNKTEMIHYFKLASEQYSNANKKVLFSSKLSTTASSKNKPASSNSSPVERRKQKLLSV